MNLECNYCQRAFPNEESLELHKTAVSNLKITSVVLYKTTKSPTPAERLNSHGSKENLQIKR